MRFAITATLLGALLLCAGCQQETVSQAPADPHAQSATPASDPKPVSAAAPVDQDPPKIQVALLLDNSGSMSGLINQARAQLWAFINEFVVTTKNGQRPTIEVALYMYGNPPATQLVPLTDNLDLVSEKLFAIAISGSSEYCGAVIQTATNDLAWSDDRDDLKVIFIAGNEEFTQGPAPYAEACKAAITKGIIINTIHCGDESAGINGKWKDAALLADGAYLCINQNKAVPDIDAPQDAELAELNTQLNNTYVAYGARGHEGFLRQAAQDANAADVSSAVAAERIVTKGNTQYVNAGWDLVDAANNGDVDLATIETDDLPDQMQEMSVGERKAHIEKMSKQRAEIQNRIQTLAEARKAYVAAELAKLADGDETLESAMTRVMVDQAAERNFVKSN